jgi:hypothetical protein
MEVLVIIFFISPFLFVLHKFNNSHLCVITLTRNSSQNTSVSTFTISVTIRGSLKEGVHQILIVYPSKSLTTGMQISSLSEFNHVINVLSDSSGTGKSGLDTSVSDDFRGQSTQQGLALIGRQGQLLESLAMRNHFKGRASGDSAGYWCQGLASKGTWAGD